MLAAAHTWPLATDPARLSRNDNADTLLNEWIVAWVQHQAPRHPLRLFEANVFYPEARTLAYSEPLMVPALIGAPVRAAGGSPVLVYNFLVLIGLALTGSAGFVVAWRWTGDALAGFATGSILAFNAHTLTRLPQLQAFHLEFLPLAMLALDAMLADTAPRVRSAAGLALIACVVLEGWTSYYGLVLTVTALAAGWAVRFERRHVVPVLMSATIALLLMAPVLLPYARLGEVRPLEEVAAYSASARDYLATPARVHFDTWSASFFGGTTALFPGIMAIVLAALAVGTGTAFRDRRARMALACGVIGVALSFGPALPGYAALYHVVVPLQGIRNAARFGYLATVAAGLLAGFGVAWLRQRWRGSQWTPVAAVMLVLAINIDAFSAPIEYVPAEAVSPLHATIRDSTAIVAEFPVYPADRVFRNAPYLLHSTEHWRPMINGYSGITPDSYVRHARALAGFPNAEALATLRSIGVTHVFVHDRALRDWTDNETADAVPRTAGLELIGRDADVALYRLRP